MSASTEEADDQATEAALTRWCAARRLRRACESEKQGPLSVLLLEAALYLTGEQLDEANAALDRLDAAAVEVLGRRRLRAMRRAADEVELEDELIGEATRRYQSARRRRMEYEREPNGPLRLLVMEAGQEIQRRRPARAMEFLKLFDTATRIEDSRRVERRLTIAPWGPQ